MIAISKSLAIILFVILSVLCIEAQIPIPNRPVGFSRGSSDSPVVFEMFLDSLCPDSKQSWPSIEQVQSHYGLNNLRLIVHFSPLVSKRNSFTVDLASYVVAQYANASSAFDWITLAFANQATFWNPVTGDLSPNQIAAMIGSISEKNGFLNSSQMIQGLNNGDVQNSLIISAKYSASRGVASVPSFLVNGVFVAGDSTWSASDWESVLDPLFDDARRAAVKADGTCPAGQTECDYLPGKVACCLAGENCIKNVGCRC